MDLMTMAKEYPDVTVTIGVKVFYRQSDLAAIIKAKTIDK